MRPFVFESATNLRQASYLGLRSGQGETDAKVQFLAGGTTLLDLMKLGVLRPDRIVDLGPVHAGHDAIHLDANGLQLGAFAKMAAAAEHPGVLAHYPAIAQSLQLAASAQLRNMATLGGNVLQKTRCTYYRDPTWRECNKRNPGSGCAALKGFNRNHAILGVDESCIAQYPGDFAIALMALDAQVELSSASGSRRIPFATLHRAVAGQPHIENTLRSGELITSFIVPPGAWTRRSLYLKVRDRTSYEFAIASAAIALDMDAERVRTVRIGLGGMASRPWRATQAEELLTGQPLTEANAQAAATTALKDAITHGHNDFKPELARRTLVRALLQARSMRVADAEL
ncbi:MAG TPA: xanthine dehydrogenase family protein subunit M [Steroidobacteraceae bacterium]|jgi:xanthine dehydrogenase YagS FAD-binding subunit|nr:xanthine dehydrogenase family protein subunit M [Steroidobacteraceae bacterium]